MAIRRTIDDVRRAWEARDPILVDLIVALASEPDPEPEAPLREGAPTFDRVLADTQTKAFRKKSLDQQRIERIERFAAVEAPDAEVPLPDRLRLHEVILGLWTDGSPFARSCLLRVIDLVPLTYGPWRALKRIFKEAETQHDLEVFAALAARFDVAYATRDHTISRRTMAYLVRRAWRSLRRIGQAMPVAYPDAASAVLARYPESWSTWRARTEGAWVFNHIFYHTSKTRAGSKPYNRSRFAFGATHNDPLTTRAFPDLWRRSPRPLFGLLERARCNIVRGYAAEALKKDFRAALREVEPAWVIRLISSSSEAVHDFVVWILGNVPKFEQGSFRELGLHDPVLRLFDSPSDEARSFAASYARTHARDLPVATLIRLADNRSEAVRKLAADLLGERDPRRDIGLDAWGRLLETDHGHSYAAEVIRKHFGTKELTPDWFANRLFSPSDEAFEFVSELLPKIHPPKTLGDGYFRDLIDRDDRTAEEPAGDVLGFAMDHLARFDPNTFDPEFLSLLLLRPGTSWETADWIDEGRLKAASIPLDLLKALAFHPDWDKHPTVRKARTLGKRWGSELAFDEDLADRVLAWLRDVRRFLPADLGFDWLMTLVRRAEPRYHDFAVEVMIKGFVPADFAPSDSPPESEKQPASEQEISVDFGGASFLFTGKLATMQRKEAEGKVRNAGGSVGSGVTAKLHYLVIGDEGSPLYGNGKKGSKQVKAEQLNAEGANIRIISETAFLQMLTGRTREVSADATLLGCERLWQLAVGAGPEDARLGQFARKYLRRHHPEMALDETDRPVDPGAEIPPEFLSFDRVRPLFFESREPLRSFALAIARYEFARWSPPGADLVRLAEAPFIDVRRFVAEALLAEAAPEHRRYRIDPDSLSPAAVYRFCESSDDATRALGLKLIARSPRLRLPQELYRLTESPDRAVRAFVLRALWSLYRDRHITDGWAPFVAPRPTIGPVARKKAAEAATARGSGPPARPEQPPAPAIRMSDLLRRMLFELPPGRLRRRSVSTDGTRDGQGEGFDRLRPLSNRLAKLAIVETVRDLAIEDEAFARAALPPLIEFMASIGKSEHAACLIAVTRIRHAHPGLAVVGGVSASLGKEATS
ncbi:BRCT domain-containing protein [Tautonia rosea]|uniref:BRCT domain-containing protein n=1 Tax=Tautonia rosea TaxID=2728037 RepID=UPI0028F4154A|nr:BRCT domain-containing protein [Tautonia rosea]